MAHKSFFCTLKRMDNDINVSDMNLSQYIAREYFEEYLLQKKENNNDAAEKLRYDYFYKYYTTMEPYVTDWIHRLKCDAKLKTIIRNSIDFDEIYRYLTILFDDEYESDSDTDAESESEIVFSSEEE